MKLELDEKMFHHAKEELRHALKAQRNWLGVLLDTSQQMKLKETLADIITAWHKDGNSDAVKMAEEEISEIVIDKTLHFHLYKYHRKRL